MQKPALCRALTQNLAVLQDRFGGSDDFYTKKLSVGGIRCAIIMFTGISSPEKLCRLALDMLDRDPAFFGGGPGLCDYLLKQSLIPAEPQPASDIEEIGELLANGMSLLLIDDCDQAVVFSTQEMPQRSISTPSGEGNMRGSQEAFTELLRNNVCAASSVPARWWRKLPPPIPAPRPNTACAMTAPWPRLKPSMPFGTVWKKSNCPCFWIVLTLPLF